MNKAREKIRLIVALSGASGAIYGIRALELLRDLGSVETHLIISESAHRTVVDETDLTVAQVRAFADKVYDNRDIGAALASGSFHTHGMLIAPCSVKTLSGVATSQSGNLILRAADVCLKERRRVVLLFRETPLHNGHIAAMGQATLNGAVVMPPVPAFYTRPATITDIVDHTVGRALDLFKLHLPGMVRWKESGGTRPRQSIAKNGQSRTKR